ncbi:MAG: 30S ribosomal protein S14 [Acidobacteriota bacterium]
MASKAAIAKNKKRQELVKRHWERRQELKSIIKNPEVDPETREEAIARLAKMPRNSSRVRVRNRCAVSGRPRGYYRKFGLSRIALRDLALRGDLPGVIKASW